MCVEVNQSVKFEFREGKSLSTAASHLAQHSTTPCTTSRLTSVVPWTTGQYMHLRDLRTLRFSFVISNLLAPCTAPALWLTRDFRFIFARQKYLCCCDYFDDGICPCMGMYLSIGDINV